MRFISKLLSIVLYPLFIPTYGMLLFCVAFGRYYMALPAVYWLVTVLGTLLLTCVIPMTAILVLIKQGKIRDIQIENAAERTTPYVYTIVSFVFWTYLLFAILKVPHNITITAAGATVALGIVTLVNRRWKISAHLTAFGGLFGGVCSFFLAGGVMPPIWLVVTLLAVALLLMYARLYLNAHTSTQVVFGFLLGLLMTFVPNWIYTL